MCFVVISSHAISSPESYNDLFVQTFAKLKIDKLIDKLQSIHLGLNRS